jgi:hypothetical protein
LFFAVDSCSIPVNKSIPKPRNTESHIRSSVFVSAVILSISVEFGTNDPRHLQLSAHAHVVPVSRARPTLTKSNAGTWYSWRACDAVATRRYKPALKFKAQGFRCSDLTPFEALWYEPVEDLLAG